MKVKKKILDYYRFLHTINNLPQAEIKKYLFDTYLKVFGNPIPEEFTNRLVLVRTKICYYLLKKENPEQFKLPRHKIQYASSQQMSPDGLHFAFYAKDEFKKGYSIQ